MGKGWGYNFRWRCQCFSQCLHLLKETFSKQRRCFKFRLPLLNLLELLVFLIIPHWTVLWTLNCSTYSWLSFHIYHEIQLHTSHKHWLCKLHLYSLGKTQLCIVRDHIQASSNGLGILSNKNYFKQKINITVIIILMIILCSTFL